MRAIIVGAGEVGYQIAKFLLLEDIEVVVIDHDKDRIKRISNELDVAVVEAEGGDPTALKEAGAERADLLLAVTNSDETNMIACLLGKAMFKIPRKIARIRNPEYFSNERLLDRDHLDIDPAINPELEVAKAVIRLLEVPFASAVDDFEGGIVKVIGIAVPEHSPISGKSLKSIASSLGRKFLLGIVNRDGRATIPTGASVIKAGDVIYLPVKQWEITDIVSLLGVSSRPARRVMILGGGRIGYYIAGEMEKRADIKIIEKDGERCKFLSKRLEKTLILHGDGADQGLLIEENIQDMDMFLAMSNNEELNIMASLLAKKLGARKAIVLVNRMDYVPIAHSLGLESVLNPRQITASSILRYVRRGDIISLTTVAQGKAEVIEARAGQSSPLIDKPLSRVKLPDKSLIGAIIRGDQVIIPSGQDVIRENDRLIFFALRESVKEIEKILI